MKNTEGNAKRQGGRDLGAIVIYQSSAQKSRTIMLKQHVSPTIESSTN